MKQEQIVIKRPLRLLVDLNTEKLAEFKQALADNPTIAEDKKTIIYNGVETAKARVTEALPDEITAGVFRIFTVFNNIINTQARDAGTQITPAEKEFIKKILTRKDPSASQVIKRANFEGEEAPIYGIYTRFIHGKNMLVEYEEDEDLRQIKKLAPSVNKEDFFTKEILPKTPDAWLAR